MSFKFEYMGKIDLIFKTMIRGPDGFFCLMQLYMGACFPFRIDLLFTFHFLPYFLFLPFLYIYLLLLYLFCYTFPFLSYPH